MICTLSLVKHISWLVAVLMLSSVATGGFDSSEEVMTENLLNIETRSEVQLCGRRPAMRSKRDDSEEKKKLVGKILNDSAAAKGEVPWFVNIVDDHSQACRGVLISEFWVITTAVCILYTVDDNISVIVGDRNTEVKDDNEQRYAVEKSIAHKLYSAHDYDVALLKIAKTNDRGIIFNNEVQPICLPVAGESPKVNDNLTIASYAYESHGPSGSMDALKQFPVSLKKVTECQKTYSSQLIAENFLCAASHFGNHLVVCVSDYGSPVTFQSGDAYVLSGIGHIGLGCEAEPFFVTSILPHVPWIQETIKENSNAKEGIIPGRTG